MELWSVARYDLGLSWSEFEDCTPGMFQALCKRRNVRIKYERYAHAMTASAVYNVNRHSADDPIVTALDFVRDGESAERKERLRQAKAYCTKAIGGMPMLTPRAKLLEIRGKAIADLQRSGFTDAEQIFNECWPHLKPTAEERG